MVNIFIMRFINSIKYYVKRDAKVILFSIHFFYDKFVLKAIANATG